MEKTLESPLDCKDGGTRRVGGLLGVAGSLSGTVSPFRGEQGTSLETPSRERASSCQEVGTTWFVSSCGGIFELRRTGPDPSGSRPALVWREGVQRPTSQEQLQNEEEEEVEQEKQQRLTVPESTGNQAAFGGKQQQYPAAAHGTHAQSNSSPGPRKAASPTGRLRTWSRRPPHGSTREQRPSRGKWPRT